MRSPGRACIGYTLVLESVRRRRVAAALGGLDTLVFAGGIGENAPAVRARICDGLGFLGIELEEKRNAASEGVISATASRLAVCAIHTDEERTIARGARHTLRT